ncbi:unnamed protein product, partial [Ectocarpus sp. 4 AP-2014]
ACFPSLSKVSRPPSTPSRIVQLVRVRDDGFAVVDDLSNEQGRFVSTTGQRTRMLANRSYNLPSVQPLAVDTSVVCSGSSRSQIDPHEKKSEPLPSHAHVVARSSCSIFYPSRRNLWHFHHDRACQLEDMARTGQPRNPHLPNRQPWLAAISDVKAVTSLGSTSYSSSMWRLSFEMLHNRAAKHFARQWNVNNNETINTRVRPTY